MLDLRLCARLRLRQLDDQSQKQTNDGFQYNHTLKNSAVGDYSNILFAQAELAPGFTP
jgi:hypothetical protein